MSSRHQSRMLNIPMSHWSAPRYFGGSVKTVLVDNQKAAVLKNNNGKVVFNSGFLLLADHYGFLPRACRPRRARTKGKVERMVNASRKTSSSRFTPVDGSPMLISYWSSGWLSVADSGSFTSSGRHRNSASRRNRCICRRCRYGLRYQLLRYPSCLLGWLYRGWREPFTACRKACVASRYRYEYRWMMNCGSTVMSNR